MDERLDDNLMNSIESYNFDSFKHLLEVGANPNSLHPDRHVGYLTPLIEAATMNHPRFIVELLKYGANPNIVVEGVA